MERDAIFESFLAVQKKVKLQEGVNGIVKLFATIERFPNSPIQKISQKASLPIPICVAIRNELLKLGWCKRANKGTVLTELGQNVISTISKSNKDFSCQTCASSGLFFPLDQFSKELEILEKYSSLREQPNTEIDQSFATPKTSLRRVLVMNHNFDLMHQNFVFLGDSDLTSVALALFVHPTSRIVVFDIDSKLKEIINSANSELHLNIKFVEHDLRKEIPEMYLKTFDCFITDPPYTQNGVKLFISRGIQLLSDEKDGVSYLSFSNKPPKQMLEIQKDLIEMKCLITDIMHGFNEYVGAQKLGGISSFYRLLVSSASVPMIEGSFEGPLYTGDMNPVLRIYKCVDCKNEYMVGKNQTFATIEQLKNQGCAHCGSKKFLKKREKKME